VNTLVFISRAHNETAFRIAEEIYEDGKEVAILFVGKGTHNIGQDKVLERLGFAELYTFASDFDSPKEEVKAIDYDKFVMILEKSERVFSWI
jgi:hypothetical protein